jgi:transposase
VRSSPGRPPKLSQRQKERLLRLLAKGAFAHGYDTDLWTTGRIVEIIRLTFGTSYHRDHIGRLMRSLGWSCQRPKRRALERDEEAIRQWKRTTWVAVKKRPRASGPTSPSSTKAASS